MTNRDKSWLFTRVRCVFATQKRGVFRTALKNVSCIPPTHPRSLYTHQVNVRTVLAEPRLKALELVCRHHVLLLDLLEGSPAVVVTVLLLLVVHDTDWSVGS